MVAQATLNDHLHWKYSVFSLKQFNFRDVIPCHWFWLLLFSCFLVVSSSMFPFLIIAHCLASEAKKQSENCRVFIKVSSSSLADSINEIIFQQSTLLSGPLTPPPSQRQVKGGSADGNVFSPNIRGRWSVIARSPPHPPLLPLPREVTVCV